MATIYTIQGTDSISSSRVQINNNFDAINLEITSLSAYFSVADSININGDAAFGGNLTVTGTSSLTGDVTITGAASLGGSLNIDGAVIKTPTSVITTYPTANNFTYSTYVIGATGTLNDGDEGQEITLASNGSYIVTVTNGFKSVGGALTTLTFTNNQFAKLTFVNGAWFVTSTSATEA